MSTLAFAYPAAGDYVTNVPIDLTNLPFLVDDKSSSQGATAAVMLQSNNADGLQLGEFSLSIPDAFFGSVEIKDISLTYSRSGGAGLPAGCQPGKGKTVVDALTGAAKTDIASGTLSAKVVVCNDGGQPALKLFHIDYQGNLQVVPDIIYLTKASGDLDPDTRTLVVNGHLSILAGAVANGCGVAGVYGQMTIKSDPFSLDAKDNAEVLCVQAGAPGSFFHLDGHGYFSEGSYINYDLGDFGSLKGSVSGEGYFVPSDGQYHLRLDGDLALDGSSLGLGTLTSRAHAVISDVGLAACAAINTPWHTYNVGFGARYSPSDIFGYPGGALQYLADKFDLKGDGCNTNDYSRIPAIAGGAAVAGVAAAPDYGFTVPTGQQVTIVLLHGQDAAPGAILHGPGGQTLDVSQPGPKASVKALVVQLPHAKETEVQIFGARAGHWTVTPAPSAPAIASVEVSSDLGKPVITGQVTGRGAGRTLHYSVRNVPAGTKIAFVENGVRGGGLLGRVTGTTGTLKFTPSAAHAGIRTIVAPADITERDAPRDHHGRALLGSGAGSRQAVEAAHPPRRADPRDHVPAGRVCNHAARHCAAQRRPEAPVRAPWSREERDGEGSDRFGARDLGRRTGIPQRCCRSGAHRARRLSWSCVGGSASETGRLAGRRAPLRWSLTPVPLCVRTGPLEQARRPGR